MYERFKIRLSNRDAQKLVTHKLNTERGKENLLETGAKLYYLGGGWWRLVSYHYAAKDIKPYL